MNTSPKSLHIKFCMKSMQICACSAVIGISSGMYMDRLHPKQQEKRETCQEQLFTDWVADRTGESSEGFLIGLVSAGNQRCGCSHLSATGTHVVEVPSKCCFPGLCPQRFPNFCCIATATWQHTTHTHLEGIPWLANGVDVLWVIIHGAHTVTQSDQTVSKAPVYSTTWRRYCCTQHRGTETEAEWNEQQQMHSVEQTEFWTEDSIHWNTLTFTDFHKSSKPPWGVPFTFLFHKRAATLKPTVEPPMTMVRYGLDY